MLICSRSFLFIVAASACCSPYTECVPPWLLLRCYRSRDMLGKFSPSTPPFLMFLLSLSFSYPRFRFSQSQLALSNRDKGVRVVPRLAAKIRNGGQSRGTWNTAAQFVKRGYAAKAPLLFDTSRFYNLAGNNKK